MDTLTTPVPQVEADQPAPPHPKLARLAPMLYTAAEVADALGVSERFVWKQHAAGVMPAAVKLGRLVRWPKAAVEAWIARGCPKPPRPRR